MKDTCLNCSSLGGEFTAQRGSRQSHADGTTHGAGRQLQKLQQQTGLDVRVRHRGESALQGGPRDPGAGAGEGERGL